MDKVKVVKATDPRRDIEEFEAYVKWDEDGDGTKVHKLIFLTKEDLLDARFQLVYNNNPVLIRDPDGVDNDDSKIIVIEPNRISSGIIMTAQDSEEEEEEEEEE